MNGSDFAGRNVSLKKALMPSARDCRSPNGPALFGPMRLCMPETILRSPQIISIVATSDTPKITTTLISRINSGFHQRPPVPNGSMANTLTGRPRS